jgi:hypothetical protein
MELPFVLNGGFSACARIKGKIPGREDHSQIETICFAKGGNSDVAEKNISQNGSACYFSRETD